MDAPEVRYTKSGDINIAYSVVGEGPFDLVFIVGWVVSTLEFAWDGRPADFFRQLELFLPPDTLRQARHRPLRSCAGHPSGRDANG